MASLIPRPPTKPSTSTILLCAFLAILMVTHAYLRTHLRGMQSLLCTISFYFSPSPPTSIIDTTCSSTVPMPPEKCCTGKQALAVWNFFGSARPLHQKWTNVLGGNAFPPVWVNTMSILQDECPAKEFDVIRSIVNKEFR